MSILDLKQPRLCRDIWDESGAINSEVQSFIVESLRNFLAINGLESYMKYIVDIVIGSSLATYYYKDDTDFDVKVIIDVQAMFKDSNARPGAVDAKVLMHDLTNLGRSSVFLTANIPGTQHDLDLYFYDTADFYPINLNKYDSLYSLSTSEWLSPPRDIDFSNDPQAILKIALEKAEPFIDALVKDISNAKRDIIDLVLFREYLKNLDDSDVQEVYSFFIEQFNTVNNSIEELVKDRVELKDMRDEAFSKPNLESELEKVMKSYNFSDENLVFKVVQRYGYMHLLWEIENIFDAAGVSPDNIDDYLSLLTK